MIRLWLLVSFFIVSSSSNAAYYKVKAEIFKNDSPGEAFTVTAMEGITAKVATQNKSYHNYLNINVAGQSSDSILLKLSFGEFRYNLNKELYHPNLIVKSGSESTIEFFDNDENQYKLKVKATKL